MIGRSARDSRKIKPAKASADSSPSQTAENSRMRLSAISIVTRPSTSAMPPENIEAIARRRAAAMPACRATAAAPRCAIGNPEPEHRRPIPDRRQRAAEQGTEHQAERHHHGVDAERPAAPLLAIERRHQRRAAAQHQCGADALQAAKHQHRAVARRTTDQQQRHRAPDQADPEDDARDRRCRRCARAPAAGWRRSARSRSPPTGYRRS